MSKPIPSEAEVRRSADDVVGFAMQAFETQWLRWTRSWNLNLAQLAWNAGNPREQPVRIVDAFPDPEMERLLQHLLEVRRKEYGDREFCVFDLDTRVDRGELVFTFVLSWDEWAYSRPCEIVVDGSCFEDEPLLELPPPRPPLVTDLGDVFSIMIPRR